MTDKQGNRTTDLPFIKEVREVIADIESAWRHGRVIVPFVGAGISVPSGVPSLTGLTEYLAKVRLYINHQLFTAQRLEHEPYFESYSRRPHEFLKSFDWPDFYELNSDLWQWQSSCPIGSESQVQNELDRKIERELILDLSTREPVLAKQLLESTNSRPRIHGDWNSLLVGLSEGDLDYVDALFRQLVAGRRPNVGHVFLAHLVHLMDWRLLLTVNFDRLVEEALRAEGLSPEVFDVSRDSRLPSPSLVNRQLAVVKLHGSSHGLRVGEQLNYALELEARERLLKYIPDNATLLVVGFGGWERRMMQLIEAVAHRKKDALQVIWLCQGFEPGLPVRKLYDQLCKSFSPEIAKERLWACRIADAGSFFVETFTRIASVFPVGKRPYCVTYRRPQFHIGASCRTVSGSQDSSVVHVFDATVGGTHTRRFRTESSRRMSEFVWSYAQDYTLIWIDLEQHHTVEGVVLELLSRLREYDNGIPAVVLPLGKSSGWRSADDTSIQLIHNALRRHRYTLAFDSLDGFGTPQTVHHGIPHEKAPAALREAYKTNLKHLVAFLRGLCCIQNPQWSTAIGNSRICLAIEPPSSRRASHGARRHPPLRFVTNTLKGLIKDFMAETHIEYHRVSASHPTPQWLPGRQDQQDVIRGFAGGDRMNWICEKFADNRKTLLLSVACLFRQPRSIVTIRSLMGRLTDRVGVLDAEQFCPKVDTLVESLSDWLLPLEGGLYWMDRAVRDSIYERVSDNAHDVQVRKWLTDKQPSDFNVVDSAVQHWWLISQHRSIARHYYSAVYLASRDVGVFFEYLYHRISGIRYGVMLAALLGNPKVSNEVAKKLKPCDGTSSETLQSIVTKKSGRPSDRIAIACLEDIESLENTLRRERNALLADVSTDVLVAWIDRVLQYDIERMRLRTTHGVGPKLVARCEKLLGLLETHLLESKSRALREKTDFVGCINVRLLQLKRLMPTTALPGELALTDGDDLLTWLQQLAACENSLNFSKGRSHGVEYLLDMAVCASDVFHKFAFWRTKRLREGIPPLIAALFEKVERSLDASGPLGIALGYRRCAIALTPIVPWRSKGNSPALNVLKEMEQRAYALVGTVAKLGEVLAAATGHMRQEEFYEYRCYLRSMEARADYLQNRFDVATRKLDGAEAGLGETLPAHRLARVVIRIYSAECLMLHADHLSTVQAGLVADDELPKRKAYNLQAQKYLERADRLLESAHSFLSGARRSVAWWFRYHAMAAQLQIERLLSAITIRGLDPQDTSHTRRNFIDVNRRGLEAIRSALGSICVEGGIGPKLRVDYKDQVLQQLVKLMLFSWFAARQNPEAFDLAGIRDGKEQPPSNAFIDAFWLRWQWISRSAGLVTNDGKAPDKIRRLLYKGIPQSGSPRDDALALVAMGFSKQYRSLTAIRTWVHKCPSLPTRPDIKSLRTKP